MDKIISKLLARLHVRTAYPGADISVVLIFAAIAGVLVYSFRHAIPDDAFIYLRFAENIVSGKGWAYNAGIPSDAATSPVYLLILSAIHMFGISGPNALLAGYALGLFVISSAIYWQLKAQGRSTAIILALVASSLPMLLKNVGLETSVFLACVVLTGMAYARGWGAATGILAGLTALARPEGIAMIFLAVGADIFMRKRIAWRTILPFLCVIAPWLIFSLVEFGSIVPHTTQIKSLQSHLTLWDANWTISFIKQIPMNVFVLPLAFVGTLIAGKEFLENRPFLLLIVGFCIVQVAGYSLLQAPVGYFWYYAPGNLAVYLSASVALIEILRRLWHWQNAMSKRLLADKPIGSSSRSYAKSRGLLVRISAFSMAAVLFYFSALEVRYLHSIFVRSMRPYRLSAEYMAIGQWLKEHADQHDFVAADEIGYIGYYSNLRLRDMLGLLDLKSITPLSEHRWDWWYTDYPSPKYIVVHKSGGPGEPNSELFPWPADTHASFINNYHLVYVSGTVGVFQKSSMQF
jgi:hypothetical protein